MKKRAIALFLVVGMLFSLTACIGGKGDTSSTGATPLQEGDPESWLTHDKVTLTVFTNEGSSTAYPPASNELPFWQFMEEYTNVHIDWEVASATGYMEVVSTRLAAGVDLPDIMMVNTLQIAESAGENGLLVDMSEYWDTHFVNTNAYWDSQGVDFESHITSADGSIYALTGMAEPVEGHITLLYNTHWLEQLGEEMPTTLDDFTALLYKMKEAGDLNGNGIDDEIVLTSSGINELMSALGTAFNIEQYEAWDAFIADENDVVTPEYTSDNMREYLRYIHGLWMDKVLDAEISSMSANLLSEKIASDRVGVFAYYSGFALTYGPLTERGQADPFGCHFSLGLALDSEYNGNDGFFMRRERALGAPTSITTACEDVELACRWLDTLYADPNVLNVRQYGIEGEDWNYAADGSIELVYPEEGRNIGAKGCGQIPLCHFQTQEQLLAGKEQYPWYLEQYDAMREECTWKSPSVKHIALFTEEEDALISNVNSDVKGMFGEYRDKFLKGQLDLDKDWDTYLENMKKMGIDDLTKAWQMIHDRTK